MPASKLAPAVLVTALVSVAVLVLGLVAALVGLYALAAPADRPDLRPLFTALAAGVPTVIGSLVVLANSKRQHAETSGKIAVITSQTNGVLSERIKAGVASALADRDAAVASSIPGQRVSDPAPVPALAGAGDELPSTP